MITIQNKQLRNLEEQVQFNSDRIQAIIEGNEVLAEMGIQVVGQVNEKSKLPDPAIYPGEYGDAYLVGIKPPYNFYIYTRPFVGETVPQWFNLGFFPVAGPQGPQGVQGPVGPRGYSTEWYTGSEDPNGRTSANPDDLYLRLTAPNNEYNGMIYVCEGGRQWTLQSSIKGPQGIPGPQGPQGERGESIVGPQGPAGPAGQFITIKGELANIDQLPDPNTVGRESAYLIPIADVNHVFLIVGEEDNLSWVDAGSFGQGGTQVTVGGVYQQNFDADTKMNKDVSQFPTGSTQGVVAGYDGTKNVKWNIATGYSQYSIPLRVEQGKLAVGTPTEAYHAANKGYVDNNFAKKADYVPVLSNVGYAVTRVYGARAQERGPELIGATSTPVSPTSGSIRANYLVMLDGTGHLEVLDPTADKHPANKKYVDDKVIETHKVSSHNASTYDQFEDLGVVVSNAHHRVHVQDGTGCWLADSSGAKIKALYNVEIPEFRDAEICYGDEGTYGYITISNTTYIFESPANPLHIFATTADIYIISHI